MKNELEDFAPGLNTDKKSDTSFSLEKLEGETTKIFTMKNEIESFAPCLNIKKKSDTSFPMEN